MLRTSFNKVAGMSEVESGEEALLRQQDVLAQFGEKALRSESLDEILQEACRLVRDALGTDLAKVMELENDGVTLLVRAGVGGQDDVVGSVRVKAVKGSPEGYALQTGLTVISDNIDEETRFEYAEFIKANGVKAIASVIILGGEGKPPFGILQVDSRVVRKFGERDTKFLQGYANLIAAAVDCLMVANALHGAQTELRGIETALRRPTRRSKPESPNARKPSKWSSNNGMWLRRIATEPKMSARFELTTS